MGFSKIDESFIVLREELDREADISEAPALIHIAAQTLGGQTFLCGELKAVEAFFAALPTTEEPKVVFEWLRISMMYANDGGAGFRRLAEDWVASIDPRKAYAAQHLSELSWN